MPRETMGGLAKGLAVLEAFGKDMPRLTISDAARVTGLSRATVLRCLNTLTEVGYTTFDGKFFSPTPRTLRIGSTYTESASLPRLAQPHLTAIRDAIDETASLAVRDGDNSLFIARSEGSRLLHTGVRIGTRLPLYASSTGQVLLSALSEDELADYLRAAPFPERAPHTPVSAEAIEHRVKTARADGIAIGDEELEPGLLSIAVPLRDATGRVVAAISVSASTSRTTTGDLRNRLRPVMQQHAKELSRLL